jgi:hypothetical protein
VCASACAGADVASDAVVVRDSSGVRIVANDLARLTQTCSIAAEPSVSIGVEDGEDPYLLAGLAGAVTLSGDRIVLANRASDELRYFDATGKFIRSAGRSGVGPGEFRQPSALQVLQGDTVYAGDFRPFRLLVFGPDGTWQRTIDLDPMEMNTPRSMNVLPGGRLLLAFDERRTDAKPSDFPVKTLSVRFYGTDGKVADTIDRIPNGREGQTKPNEFGYYVAPLFESYAQVRAREDRIVSGHGSASQLNVRRVAEGSPLEMIIRWEAGDLEITAAELAAERERLSAAYAGLPEAQRTGLQAYLQVDIDPDRPVAERFPAFGLVRLGRDGRVWVREFLRPADSSGKHRWIAFAADGRFDCRLETPRFTEYFEFGADYLLVADPDTSTDVERLRRYPLTRSTGAR